MLGISFYILSNMCASSSQTDSGEKIEYEQYTLDVDIDTRSWYKKVKDNMLKEKKEELEHKKKVLQYQREKERELAVQKAKEEREKRERQESTQVASRGNKRNAREFTATAYDLTVASCGKSQSHPAYGVTANGTSLKGQTLQSARAIAVDPKVIKLGSKVHVEFLDSEYKHLTGVFNAVDTGGAIKGNRVDIFFGDTGDSQTSNEVWKFGKRKVVISVLD